VDFAKTITATDLKKKLNIIASKEMEGRETATEGQRKAAAYIEEQFRSLGLLPGNNRSYQFNYPLYQDSLLNTSIEINGQSFQLDKDFFVSISQNNTSTFRFSEIVFAGNGEINSTQNDYEGLDVHGKAVLVLGSPRTLEGGSRYPNPKLEAAKKNGAVAVLYIENIFPRTTKTNLKGSMYLNYFQNSISPNQFIISEKIAKAIMGEDLAKAKFGIIQLKTYPANIKLEFSKKSFALQSSNVMGLLEGTDLKDEYVYITAHYDHLGKKDTVIYYGADDDGSGTVGVLEIAEAFVKAKAAGNGPRRSIIFMTVSGEEKGLLGSEYYTDHPVYPFEKTTVDLNIDMIGRSDASRKQGDSANYVYVVGDDK
ncbi:MAG: M28 family peptidase, partial [Bacteroidia bacterium]|nr:M28 family peptidase [Bacteroidia bacterium]